MGTVQRTLRNRARDAVRRVSATHFEIDNPHNVPFAFFANSDVHYELDGIAQALDVVALQETVERLSAWDGGAFWGDPEAGALERVVLTPDMHRGAGMPVGTVMATRDFVVPRAVGNDICCGMRMLITDARLDDLEAVAPALERTLRGIFFEGRRQIPMSPRQREAMLREGLWGLWETRDDNAGSGLWRRYDADAQLDDLERVHLGGVLAAEGTFAFDDYIRASGARDGRDSQIGSVGGGNHFVEIQRVAQALDGATAHAWGLQEDQVAIMIHSGSVGLGHVVGRHFKQQARALYPDRLQRPAHGFDLLPTCGPHADVARAYLDALSNAANFGFANRLFLGLMAVEGLAQALGREVHARLLYDAPHNLIWAADGGPLTPERGRFIHRKGACPAWGPEPELEGPFRYTGHPVLIPGSMGASSFVLAGQGSDASLQSACHGAGRALSRGAARNVPDDAYSDAITPLRVVTPIDPNAPQVRARRDILAQYHGRLREEAPYAYKPVTPVVQTVEDAQIARRVARMEPWLTIKG